MASPFGTDTLSLIAGMLAGFGHGIEDHRTKEDALNTKALEILGKQEGNLTVAVKPEDLASPTVFSQLLGGSLKTKAGDPVFKVGNNYFAIKPREVYGPADFGFASKPEPTASPLGNSPIIQQDLTLGLKPPVAAPIVQPQIAPAPQAEATPEPPAGDKLAKNIAVNMQAFQRLTSQRRQQLDSIIDPLLVKFPNVTKEEAYAVIAQESQFNKDAVSPAGAQGSMQLMPATQRRHRVANPFDEAQNIEGGIKELSRLKEKYGNDQRKSYAAYNAGEGPVDEHDGVPPYAETQNFVPSVMNTAAKIKPLLVAATPPNRTVVEPTFDNASPDEQARLRGWTGGYATAPPSMKADIDISLSRIKRGAPGTSVQGAVPAAPTYSPDQQEQIPTLTGKVLGVLPGAAPGFPGRKIMENVSGGYSTHINSTLTFGDKTFIVPHIFNGKVVSTDEAARIIRENKFVDPDTGQPLTPYNSVEEALQAERNDHDRLQAAADKIVRSKGATPETSPSQMVAGPATPTPPVATTPATSTRIPPEYADLAPEYYQRVLAEKARLFSGRPKTPENRDKEFAYEQKRFQEFRQLQTDTIKQYKELAVEHHFPMRSDVRTPADLAQVVRSLEGRNPTDTQAAHFKQATAALKAAKDDPEQLRTVAAEVQARMSAHHYTQPQIDHVFTLSGTKATLELADKQAEEEGLRRSRLQIKLDEQRVLAPGKTQETRDAERAQLEERQRFGSGLPDDARTVAYTIASREKIPITDVYANRMDDVMKELPAFVTAKQMAHTAGLPLPDVEKRKADDLYTAKRSFINVRDKYTPEEIKQYTGLIRGRMEGYWQQFKDMTSFGKTDAEQDMAIQKLHGQAVQDAGAGVTDTQKSRFFEFAADVKRIEDLAFNRGGTALSAHEKEVIFGYLPTLRDVATGAFLAKLGASIEHTDFATKLLKETIGLRYGNASAGIEKIDKDLNDYSAALKDARKQRSAPAVQPTTQTNTPAQTAPAAGADPVEQALRDKGLIK